jgi:hypothetical protein
MTKIGHGLFPPASSFSVLVPPVLTGDVRNGIDMRLARLI